jgi:hypothetical protein
MNKILVKEYLEKLKHVNNEREIDNILDEMVPVLKKSGVSPMELMMYFKMSSDNGFDFQPKTQDHRSTHTNAAKAQIIIQKLMAKFKN